MADFFGEGLRGLGEFFQTQQPQKPETDDKSPFDEAIKFLGENKLLALGAALAAFVAVPLGVAATALAFTAYAKLTIVLAPIALAVGLVALAIILGKKYCGESKKEKVQEEEKVPSNYQEVQPQQDLYVRRQKLLNSIEEYIQEKGEEILDNCSTVLEEFEKLFNSDENKNNINTGEKSYKVSKQIVTDIPRTSFEIDNDEDKKGYSNLWTEEGKPQSKEAEYAYAPHFLENFGKDLSHRGLGEDEIQAIIVLISQSAVVEMTMLLGQVAQRIDKRLIPESIERSRVISINTQDKEVTLQQKFQLRDGNKIASDPITISVTYKIDSGTMSYKGYDLDIPELDPHSN